MNEAYRRSERPDGPGNGRSQRVELKSATASRHSPAATKPHTESRRTGMESRSPRSPHPMPGAAGLGAPPGAARAGGRRWRASPQSSGAVRGCGAGTVQCSCWCSGISASRFSQDGVAEGLLEVLGRLVVGVAHAGEQALLVCVEAELKVVGMGREGLGEFGAVADGPVGSFTVGGLEVGGVADEGHAGRPLPLVRVGQGVARAQDGRGVGVGDQCGEFGCPAGELGRDTGGGSGRIGEVDGVEPLRRPGERHVGVQGVASLAVSGDRLVQCRGEHRRRRWPGVACRR